MYIIFIMIQKIECKITGRVQMVMFRDFTKRKAKSLGIVGVVKNQQDGSVFISAEGEEGALKKFIKFLSKGSILARVDNVEVKWISSEGEFSNFKIIY